MVIAPNAVLTAAHVVAGGTPESWTFNLNIGGELTARLPVASIRVHPGFQGFGRGRDGLAHDDIAVVRLAGIVPFGTPLYELARRAPRPGERLILVGYGNGGSSAGGASVPADPAVKRVGANVVEQVYQDVGGAGRVELYRFAYTPLPARVAARGDPRRRRFRQSGLRPRAGSLAPRRDQYLHLFGARA